jgi:penicillin-binding protein 2
VVVLGLGDERVLALGRHLGADPEKTAVRPGSTVKPLTAWVASRANVLESGHRVVCSGNYAPIEGMHCFGTHGSLGLTDALAISCNAYFFELGQKLGFERVRAGFLELGFGQGIGLLPTLEWLDAHPEAGVSRERSLEQTAAAIATGHGPFEVTPLALARAYSRLAKSLFSSRGKLNTEILDGLRRGVQGADGTGKRAAVEGLDVAGKTGTAESTPVGVEADDSKQNGWFAGFAPANAPEILVVVLTVEAGPGGEAAAPIAGRIFRDWHQQR